MLATESLTRRFLFVLISQHVLRPNRVARKRVPPHQLCSSPLPPSPSACFYAGPAIFFYFYVKDDGERPINCDIIQIWAPAPQICCKMKKACYFRSNSNRQNVLNKDIEISKKKMQVSPRPHRTSTSLFLSSLALSPGGRFGQSQIANFIVITSYQN